MDLLLDIMLIVAAILAVLFPLLGVDIIDKNQTKRIKKVTPFGWILFASIILAGVIQITQTVQKHKSEFLKAESVKVIAKADSSERAIDKENTNKMMNELRTRLNEIHSAVEKKGFNYDSITKRIIPKPWSLTKIDKDKILKLAAPYKYVAVVVACISQSQEAYSFAYQVKDLLIQKKYLVDFQGHPTVVNVMKSGFEFHGWPNLTLMYNQPDENVRKLTCEIIIWDKPITK